MTRAFLSQTNFSAGELDPRMLGRSDLRSFENGAAKLRNVVVETTGGVRRRPGMAYVAPAAAGPFHLLVFGGSQGARVFGRVTPLAIALLPDHRRRLE